MITSGYLGTTTGLTTTITTADNNTSGYVYYNGNGEFSYDVPYKQECKANVKHVYDKKALNHYLYKARMRK